MYFVIAGMWAKKDSFCIGQKLCCTARERHMYNYSKVTLFLSWICYLLLYRTYRDEQNDESMLCLI